MNIVCTQCGTTNRIPEERLQDGPKCGKCKHSVFDGKPADIDVQKFNTVIAKNETPVVVDFWAPWCGPCVGMAPAYEQATAELEPEFRLMKINTESYPDLNERFGIRGIPTLIMFAGGKELARQSGAMGLQDIVSWVRQNSATGHA